MDKIEEFLSLRGLEVNMNYPNCFGLYQPIWKWAPTPLDKEYNEKVEKYNNRINLILSEVDNPKGTFIDIGCSEGYNTFEISYNGGDVVGVDNVDRVIPTAEFLRLHYKFDGVKIIAADSTVANISTLIDEAQFPNWVTSRSTAVVTFVARESVDTGTVVTVTADIAVVTAGDGDSAVGSAALGTKSLSDIFIKPSVETGMTYECMLIHE